MDSKTGAVRSSDADQYRFDLIHPIALMALARLYAEGAEKYGDMNCERGFPINDLWNHVMLHKSRWDSGDRSEPHLARMLWGTLMMVVSEVLWPELNTKVRGPGCTPPDIDPAEDARLKQWRAENPEAVKAMSQWSVDELPEVQAILESRRRDAAFKARIDAIGTPDIRTAEDFIESQSSKRYDV